MDALLCEIFKQHPRGTVNDALRRTGGAAGKKNEPRMIEPDSNAIQLR